MTTGLIGVGHDIRYTKLIAWLRTTMDAGHQLVLDKIIALESAADRDGCCHTSEEIENGGVGTHSMHSHFYAFEDALRALALLHADRPGYREEWRP